MRSSLIVVLSLALLTGCAAPSAQESADIAAMADAWQEALNAGDLEGVVALYAEDARFMPPNGEMGTGHDAIRADIQGLIDAGLTGELETVEAMAAGDLGYRLGTYTLSTADGQVADKGKYIEIWRQRGGEWKITADIYNSDMPAFPQGTLLMGIHEVGDAATWLAAWQESDARRAQFAANGVAGVRAFQSPEDANLTGLLLDVADMEAFQTWLQSEEGQAAAAEDTVKMDTLKLVAAVD